MDGAAFFLTAALDAFEALADRDPDLDHEQVEIAVALAAEATGPFGPSIAPECHREAVADLLSGFAAPLRPSAGEGTPP